MGSENVNMQIEREICPCRLVKKYRASAGWSPLESVDVFWQFIVYKLAPEPKMSSASVDSSSCKCNGTCSRKDGSKSKGCPCKPRGEFCIALCKCLMTGKKCQNQVGFTISCYFLYWSDHDMQSQWLKMYWNKDESRLLVQFSFIRTSHRVVNNSRFVVWQILVEHRSDT